MLFQSYRRVASAAPLPFQRGSGALSSKHPTVHGGVPCPRSSTSRRPPASSLPPLSFATRTGDLLFVSGIPGFDDKGALADGFEAQFGFVVANIKRVLGEAGATFRDLVKVNVLLTRASDVATMNVLYASAFGPAPYPRPHHLRGAGAARSENADRDRMRGAASGAVTRYGFRLRSLSFRLRPLSYGGRAGEQVGLLHTLTASAWFPSGIADEIGGMAIGGIVVAAERHRSPHQQLFGFEVEQLDFAPLHQRAHLADPP